MKPKKNLYQILHNATQILLTGNKKQAFKYLSDYCNTEPNNAEIARDIGIYLQQNKMPIKAEMFYQRSLSINNNQASVYFNLGVIYQTINKTPEAINAYRHATELSADYAKAYANLGYLYHESGELDNCQKACLAALKLEPDNPQIKHMMAALGVTPPPETADQQYIKNLYKDYAGYYDEHLSVTLKSKVPELIHATTLRFLKNNTSNSKLLDLGCGTGICGQLFTDLSNTIVGVDLSEEMIAEARKKEFYKQLYVSDIAEHLASNNEKFDIVIASDVLIYIGNLQNIFDGVYKLLNKSGIFTFSVESALIVNNDYTLDATGRYKHSSDYISRISAQSGFDILSAHETELREQNSQPVIGQIYALKKPINSNKH